MRRRRCGGFGAGTARCRRERRSLCRRWLLWSRCSRRRRTRRLRWLWRCGCCACCCRPECCGLCGLEWLWRGCLWLHCSRCSGRRRTAACWFELRGLAGGLARQQHKRQQRGKRRRRRKSDARVSDQSVSPVLLPVRTHASRIALAWMRLHCGSHARASMRAAAAVAAVAADHRGWAWLGLVAQGVRERESERERGASGTTMEGDRGAESAHETSRAGEHQQRRYSTASAPSTRSHERRCAIKRGSRLLADLAGGRDRVGKLKHEDHA